MALAPIDTLINNQMSNYSLKKKSLQNMTLKIVETINILLAAIVGGVYWGH
jgi:hypothetical protein